LKSLKKTGLPVQAPFFTAVAWKLALMSLCTSGFYEFYWFYQNWKMYKKRSGEPIKPGWRATFSPVWAYSFFRHIRESADGCGIETNFDPVRLAAAYVLLFLAQYLSDYLAAASIFTFVPIIFASNLAAEVNKTQVPDYRENNRLSVGNWFIVLIGGTLNVGLKFFHPSGFSLDDIISLNRHLMF
jgi:hypothetical protein